ncbi:hypothetical protein KQI89_10855 [Clostridium sp. MSJ-4]|uniref:Dipeptidyl peptidase IV n=1 Tax=Clostridium simiarum TaxID=2841506 RepID=A0ABS6F176_9CLOT|nr:hypothetical protein [Clostridium simiarum]MBU5592262.1 hypothetical protein [Clostridium simiarum]
MKKLKGLIIIAVISIIFQCVLLVFLDRYYLVDNYNFEVTYLEKVFSNNITRELPKDLGEKLISCDGKYIAYYENLSIKIINILSGEESYIVPEEDKKIDYFNWSEDGKEIIIAEKGNEINLDKIDICSYDVENNKRSNIYKIKDMNSNHSIFLIKKSANKNITYIGYGDDSEKNIIKVKSGSDIKKLDLQIKEINYFYILPNEEEIIYTDITKTNIYSSLDNKKLSLKDNVTNKFIHMDYHGRLYFEEVKDGKVNKVKLYTMDTDGNLVRGDTIDVSSDEKSVFINNKGQILINNKSLGIITSLKDNKEYKYQGDLLNVYDNGFYTVFNNRLIQYKLDF